MSGFVFETARPCDDAALCRLVAAEPVPGAIAVRYGREPSYFAGCRVMGPTWQVLVCRERASGRVVGVACRAVRPMFVNGEPRDVGYLGQLRIDSAFRGRALLRRGYAAMRPLMEDGKALGHITTIIEGNELAGPLLAGKPRPGMPRYREVARLETLAIAASRRPPVPAEGCALSTGTGEDLDTVVRFLNAESARRQFAPYRSAADFSRGATASPGFALEDLFVARRRGIIVGTLGLWDQSSFKQSTVSGYAGSLGRWRGALNLLAPLARRPRLPAPGSPLRHGYACCGAVAGDDPIVFDWLLRVVLARARARGLDYVLLGLDGRDPLMPVARRLHPVAYSSRIYAVAWDEDRLRASLDDRPTGLEVAAL